MLGSIALAFLLTKPSHPPKVLILKILLAEIQKEDLRLARLAKEMETRPVKEATVVVKVKIDESLEDGEDMVWSTANTRAKRYLEEK